METISCVLYRYVDTSDDNDASWSPPQEYRQRRNSNGSVNSGQSANSSVFSCKGYRQGGPINQCTIGRRELLEWLCQSLDLSLSDMTQVYPRPLPSTEYESS